MPSSFSLSVAQRGCSLTCFVYGRRHAHRTDEDGVDENCWAYPLAILGTFQSEGQTKYTLRFACALFFGGPSTKDVNRVSVANIGWPTTPAIMDLFRPLSDSSHNLLCCFDDTFPADTFNYSPKEDLNAIKSADKHFAFCDTVLPSFSLEAFHGIIKGGIYDKCSDYWKIINEIRGYIVHRNSSSKVKLYTSKCERKKVTSRVRRQVLERDGFKCVDCGRSPRNDSSCVLHVDHRLAIANGGTSEMQNLQTLCDWCNLGKGVGLDWKLM